jgi:hypothetical protein
VDDVFSDEIVVPESIELYDKFSKATLHHTRIGPQIRE